MKAARLLLSATTPLVLAGASPSYSSGQNIWPYSINNPNENNQKCPRPTTVNNNPPTILENNVHLTKTSKNLKDFNKCPRPTVDDDHMVECGATYYNEGVIALTQNLICGYNNITEIDEYRNAAITLSGSDTVLDCNGYTISQITPSISSAVKCDIPSSILERKQTCGLQYYIGTLLKHGATLRNCNVQNFYIGTDVEGQGVIEESNFKNNYVGVQLSTYPPFGMAEVRRR